MAVPWRYVALLLVCSLAPPDRAQAQSPRKSPASPSPSPAVPKTPSAGFSLSLTPQRVVTFSAIGAKAGDVAQALSRELKIPVRVSPLVATRQVTLRLNRGSVEDLLNALAPQVYIDYELRWDRPHEDWVGVELTGYNEREPATPVEPKAFVVLAGSTDDEEATGETMARDQAASDEARLGKDPPREGPVLDVSVKDGLVSIRARRQMVAAVLLDVASKAGMGFETRGPIDQEFIDLDVRGLPVDQLPAVVARPGFAVLMRRNLTAGAVRPVAVLLGSEAGKAGK